MTQDKVRDWLDAWANRNITDCGHSDEKRVMRGDAKMCVADAKSAGFTVQELKVASGGDLESYLLDRQNELSDSFDYNEVRRAIRDGLDALTSAGSGSKR